MLWNTLSFFNYFFLMFEIKSKSYNKKQKKDNIVIMGQNECYH